MPRPHTCRRVGPGPAVSLFKPAGVPHLELEEIQLSLDEYEAIRLADSEGLYQEEAAERMGISRATFGRILEAAHHKVAETLTSGCALRIKGGPVHPVRGYRLRCQSCTHEWPVEASQARPQICPRCESVAISCCSCCRVPGRRRSTDHPRCHHPQRRDP
jgi:uncharacterized protein